MSGVPVSQASQRAELSAAQRELLLKRIRGGQAGTEGDGIKRLPREDSAPLSFAQQRMWFMDQVTPAKWMNNIPSAVRVPGPLDAGVVERVLNEIVRRHEALRTVFRLAGNEPVQVVMPDMMISLETLDLRTVPRGEREDEALRLAEARARLPFDLERGPLLRASLLRLDATDHLFVLTVHHIAADGWSMGIMATELAALYAAFTAGHASPLPELPIQYVDYAVWQRHRLAAGAFDGQIAYWKRRLASLPTLGLPTDRPRPAVRSNRGAHWHVLVPRSRMEALSSLCREEDATPFMGLLAVFYATLARHTGQEDIAVGSYVAGRNRIQIEKIIGFFLNTLVLRLDLSGRPSAREVLRRVRQMTLDAYEHQDVPFEQLVQELQMQPDLSRNPLCQVAFQLQNASGVASGTPASGPALAFGRDTAVFDLAANAFETVDGMNVQFEYNIDLFDSPTIERLAAHFAALVESVVAQPDGYVGTLPMLSAQERRCLLEGWNDTRRDRDWSVGVVDLFEAQVRRREPALAFVCGSASVSYGELNRRSNQLARYLRDRGAHAGRVVGVCLERSIDASIALLAVWKAGSIYLPLDPAYPAQRLGFMLADAGAAVLLTDRAHADLLSSGADRVLVDDERDAIAECSAINLGIGRQPDDVAYIIYTSGSTGQPKGIAAPHVQILNRLHWMWDAYPFGANEVACHKTALSFVDSLWELLGGLLAGVPTTVLGDAVVRDPSSLVDELAIKRVTRIWLVPSLLQTLLETVHDLGSRLPDLTFWVSSGEPLPRHLLERFALIHPTATLFNLYGTSEAWDSTWHKPGDERDTAHGVPIGRPIDNTRVHVLDHHGELAPIGVPGELHVGGLGVACGYVRQDESDSSRFLPDTYSPSGGRLYRTGDLVRWRDDGCLEYLGRIDTQIKIRGQRIEPGEVEAVLHAHPGVAHAVVVACAGIDGEQALAAYCTTRDATPPSRSQVHQFLRRALPEAMIPTTVTFLRELPLTPSGKVDRRALPEPTSVAENEPPDRDAQGPVEPVLAEIWAELLGHRRIGVHRNFFTELGGHSLLAMRMAARVRERFKRDLPVRTVFESPTIAELAIHLQQAGEVEQIAVPELARSARDRYRL